MGLVRAYSEARRALQGALDILFGRPNALAAFDFSVEGFWGSFAAIVLLIPAFAVSTIGEAQLSIMLAEMPNGVFPWGPFVFTRVVALIVDWVTFPILLGLAAKPLGIGGRYAAYIIVRNWASVVSAAIYVIPEILLSFGLVGTDGWLLASLITLVAVLAYNYRVARLALGTPVAFSIGLVILDFLVSIGVSTLIDRLIGP